MNEEHLHELREMTRFLTEPLTADDGPPAQGELHKQLAALSQGAATWAEIGPTQRSWFTFEWLRDHPTHPFSQRLVRQKASGWFVELSRKHPDAITPEALDGLHAALFDISASVAYDASKALGILGRTESVGPLRGYGRIIANIPGWQLNRDTQEWALLRITDPALVEPARGTPVEPVLAVKRLGPDLIQLVQRDEEFWLRNPESGVEKAISKAESYVFATSSDSRLEAFFDGVENLDPHSVSRLGEVAVGLLGGLPLSDTLATLIDTTTVTMAELTVNGLLRPEGLLDLATLIHSCVYYDFVLVDATNVQAPPEIRDIIVPVRPFEASALDSRWTIAVEHEKALHRDPQLRMALNASWSDMLGSPVSIDFDSFDSITDSPGVTQYFPGGPSVGFYDPIEDSNESPEKTNQERSRSASVQSFRYWINETVASGLGVAYNCTTLRYPVERIALARRSAYLGSLERLLDVVAPEFGSVAASPSESGFLKPVRVPNLLGIVLQRARTREDIWNQVILLREKFTPLREVLRSGRANGEHDSVQVNRILDDLTAKNSWVPLADGAITIASTVASGALTSGSAGALAMRAASMVKPAGFLQRVTERIRRPELYVLRSFATEVKGLQHRGGDIERLWSAPLDRRWIAAAARISNGGSRSESQFRQ